MTDDDGNVFYHDDPELGGTGASQWEVPKEGLSESPSPVTIDSRVVDDMAHAKEEDEDDDDELLKCSETGGHVEVTGSRRQMKTEMSFTTMIRNWVAPAHPSGTSQKESIFLMWCFPQDHTLPILPHHLHQENLPLLLLLLLLLFFFFFFIIIPFFIRIIFSLF